MRKRWNEDFCYEYQSSVWQSLYLYFYLELSSGAVENIWLKTGPYIQELTYVIWNKPLDGYLHYNRVNNCNWLLDKIKASGLLSELVIAVWFFI